MKKVLFSTIALVAFSFAGMANNEGKEVVLDPKCDNIARDTYYIWYGNGFSDEVARQKAKEAKDSCEAELKKKKEISTAE